MKASAKWINSEKSARLVAFAVVAVILLSFFSAFRVLRYRENDRVKRSLESILRNEYSSANSWAMAKAISNLESLRLVSCVKLIERTTVPVTYYDTSTNPGCSQFGNWQRNGLVLTALNGTEYELYFEVGIRWTELLLELTCYFATALSLMYYLRNLRAEQAELRLQLEKTEAISALAAQVSHDIRSPLSALNMVVGSLRELSEENRLIIRNATNRINDIANQLLRHSKNAREQSKSNTISSPSAKHLEPIMIGATLDSIISEKRAQLREKMNVEIHGDLSAGYGLFSLIDGTEFGRVVSNLVNNSVEAFDKGGQVYIKLHTDQGHAIITIQDNGKGIPEHILARLGERGVSYGKDGTQSGSGLGVYYAKTCVSRAGGRISFKSRVGVGTTVTIELPLAKSPRWFLGRLKLRRGTTVVTLDDDQTIHQVWSGRFKSSDLLSSIKHVTFTSIKNFETWLQSSERDNIIFLIDYEFLGHDGNGLDVIENHYLAKQSVLVTSRYDEKPLRERAERLGVKILPKGLVPFIPLVFENGN